MIMEDAHRELFNDNVVGNPQTGRDRADANKFIAYYLKLEEENKLHNTANKTSAVLEYILSLERANNELNNRMGQLEQKIGQIEKHFNSRKLFAPSFVKRKDQILNAIEKNKILDVNEAKELLGLKSKCYVLQIMKEIAKEADVAFIVGDSRIPSRLASKHYTFQEVKDWLLSRMPLGSSMLISRLESQFFIPSQKLPEMVRFLHPQFKHLAWKDGQRIERVR